MFCLSRFGFTHQDITNYTFFLCFLRKKDTCTWWKKTEIWKIDACEPRLDFHIVVWQYHAFCLSRLGLTHQNFTNYLFFLCLPRKKDPCTWWIKKMDMKNCCLWVMGLFAYGFVVVSHLLPVKIWLHTSNFHKYIYFFCLSSWTRTCAHGESKK
jgi:hypothetical protein